MRQSLKVPPSFSKNTFRRLSSYAGESNRSEFDPAARLPPKPGYFSMAWPVNCSFFIASLQKRLKLWKRKEPAVTEPDQISYWRLFPVDSYDLRDQLEVLLCGYAHYARQTSEACTKLQQAGDLQSSELLAAISKRIDRCLWFLEIHLEGLALRMDDNRLPAWPEGKYPP